MSDILAVASDDYDDYISTNMINSVIAPEKPKKSSEEMSKNEI